jgi:hypothetical protein
MKVEEFFTSPESGINLTDCKMSSNKRLLYSVLGSGMISVPTSAEPLGSISVTVAVYVSVWCPN